MKKDGKKYKSKFIAPIRYFLRNQIPIENEIFRNDGVIYRVYSDFHTYNIYQIATQGYNRVIFKNSDGK